MAAFSAPINKTCAFQLGDKLSHLLRHEITLGYFARTRNRGSSPRAKQTRSFFKGEQPPEALGHGEARRGYFL